MLCRCSVASRAMPSHCAPPVAGDERPPASSPCQTWWGASWTSCSSAMGGTRMSCSSASILCTQPSRRRPPNPFDGARLLLAAREVLPSLLAVETVMQSVPMSAQSAEQSSCRDFPIDLLE